MHGHPHPHPAWYPHSGYDYAPFDFGPIPIDAEFVGAPPPAVVTYVPEKPFPWAAVAGLLVAGAVVGYFIYAATDSTPVQKKINRAAFKIIGQEAKRHGKVAAKHAGRAASDLFTRTVDRFATPARSKPRFIHVEAVPVK
jgi:hypothetical protein